MNDEANAPATGAEYCSKCGAKDSDGDRSVTCEMCGNPFVPHPDPASLFAAADPNDPGPVPGEATGDAADAAVAESVATLEQAPGGLRRQGFLEAHHAGPAHPGILGEEAVETDILGSEEEQDQCAEQQETIAKSLRVRLGRDVNIETRIDENLIGGAVITAGDVVIDGSLRARLDGLANALIK